MNIIVKLQRKYVNVEETDSYGGSQNFFKTYKTLGSKGKVAGGCGVVALGDTIAYLLNDTLFCSVEEYCKYFNLISKRILYFSTRLGMSFIQMHLGAISLFKRYGIKHRLYWCFNLKKLYPRVVSMLENDIPAILCIPKILGNNKQKRGLALYDPDTKSVLTTTYGHFVVVTGAYSEEEKIYFEISSWGKRYLIEYGEFVRFVRKTPIGLLGHMLYIK